MSRDIVVHNSGSNDFDLVQGIYDGLSSLAFVGDIHRSQVMLLPEVEHVESALVIGGGTGRFLLEFLKHTHVKRVVYIENSEKMLRRSRALVERNHPEWLGRVEFRLGTEASLTPADGRFSLIVTHFFLSCFGQQNCTGMIERLHPWLAPRGRWLFSDFQVPERGFWHYGARFVYKVMFGFFNLLSNLEAKGPPDFDEGFRKVGLKVLVDRPIHFKMISARLLAPE